MLNKYEKAMIDVLIDILETEDLRKAPAGRTIDFGKYSFSVVAKLFGDEIVLAWHDDKGEVFISITDWKKRWTLTIDVFATAMRAVVENL